MRALRCDQIGVLRPEDPHSPQGAAHRHRDPLADTLELLPQAPGRRAGHPDLEPSADEAPHEVQGLDLPAPPLVRQVDLEYAQHAQRERGGARLQTPSMGSTTGCTPWSSISCTKPGRSTYGSSRIGSP